MRFIERSCGREGVGLREYLKASTFEAASRLSNRIGIEQIGLPTLDVPFGGETGVVLVDRFFAYAKDGYNLSLKCQHVGEGDIRGLLALTQPVTETEIWEFMEKRGVSINQSDPSFTEHKIPLGVFWHVVSTIGALGGEREVNFKSLNFKAPVSPDKVSSWYDKPDTEGLWNLIEDMENTTHSMLYDRNPIDVWVDKNPFKAAHFFAAGRKLVEEVFQ